MKKKVCIIMLLVIALLGILFIPIPAGHCKDGGTRVYSALTYKIVKWHRLTDDGVYEQTRVYFLPRNRQSIDELWELEKDNVEYRFLATIVEINGSSVLVEPLENEPERYSADRISFSTAELSPLEVKAGDVVEITYNGEIMESYPAQIIPTRWSLQ